MASEITSHDQDQSPSLHDDGNGLGLGDGSRGTKRQRPAAEDDDDDDDKPGRERRKIEIKFIQDKSRRHITFSKRKAGIMKKVRRRCFACIALHHRL
jgi:pheromone receptor transcription factor